MSYDTDKVKVLQPGPGYDSIAKEYSKFHNFLNNWDKRKYEIYLPRSLKGLDIVDLGGGDGRSSKFFEGKGVNRYLVTDISEKMLLNGKSWYEKMQFDLEENFPLEDESFDVALSFFVLLHIKNIENFFSESYRILKEGGRLILFHHPQRREYVYGEGIEKFKIFHNNYRYSEIEKIAVDNFFEINSIDVKENGLVIGKIYCFVK